ncbi:hypothetical protein BJY04DRAFT_214268 [Aspergillus karnatakaensis]|uniref:fungal specific transcription factor domain-containing protein n=1 Tax=Aspergillus karnatakaensis TaxID=1810916 RepID=UPI003CCDF1B8
MAVALGIHRRTGVNVTSGHSSDPHLLKRIWWTLAVRDAHCSALLGRPFRINMFQCDMNMLTVEDFADEHGDSSTCGCRESFEYQIHVTKLSLILRNIIYFRFGPATQGSTVELLQGQLATWKAHLPSALQSVPGQPPASKTAVHLDLLFHYHTMLLHMDQPCQPQAQPMPSQPSPPVSFPGSAGYDSTAATETSALTTSSSAIKLMTQNDLSGLPHEVFPGFFVAGIILYQQAHGQTGNPTLARMIRSSFDNCQMLLTQAQNTWDPGVWALKVFEFLSANDNVNSADVHGHVNSNAGEDLPPSGQRLGRGPASMEHGHGSNLSANSATHSNSHAQIPEDSFSAWAGAEARMDYDRSLGIDLSDYMLLPNFFPTPFTSQFH